MSFSKGAMTFQREAEVNMRPLELGREPSGQLPATRLCRRTVREGSAFPSNLFLFCEAMPRWRRSFHDYYQLYR